MKKSSIRQRLVDDALLEAESYLAAQDAPNDPDFDAELKEREEHRRTIAKHVTVVHWYDRPGDQRVELALGNKKSRPAAAETVRAAGALFDAEIVRHGVRETGDVDDRTQQQPAKHRYYKGSV